MLYSGLRLGSLSLDLKEFDFRKAAIGLTAATVIFASGTGAIAQTQLASTAAPATSVLAKHCDDIKMVFEYAKFQGDYKRQIESFLGGGCNSPVPIPRDTYNIPRFNTAAGILQNGGGITIAPN